MKCEFIKGKFYFFEKQNRKVFWFESVWNQKTKQVPTGKKGFAKTKKQAIENIKKGL